MPRLFPAACLALVTSLLIGCADTASSDAAIQLRHEMIASEPQAGYYIGRRFAIDRTQFWGYLRKPGQQWEDAKLVIMNESRMRQPDRLHEMPTDNSNAHGYDHNYEYHIWGNFSGRTVYDPNSDLFLPEFTLTKWELVNSSPGWLFKPKERYDGEHLIRWNAADQALLGHRG
jgi:hypothetical protein